MSKKVIYNNTSLIISFVVIGLFFFNSIAFSQQELEYVDEVPQNEEIHLSETSSDVLTRLYERGVEDGCPYGSIMIVERNESKEDLETQGKCYEVEDRRAEFVEKYTKEGINPNYLKIEDGYIKLPQLGGIGAGVTYKSGFFSVTDSSSLIIDYIAWPNGINLPSGAGQPTYATTSTNRTRCGAEAAVWYSGGRAAVLVEDWGANNCTTGPFTVNVTLSTKPCWVSSSVNDPSGNQVQRLRFINDTNKIGTNLWENTVMVKNWCSSTLELIHSSTYTTTTQDCSNGCTHGSGFSIGWWGPIVESFNTNNNNLPQIKKLGVYQSFLGVDNTLNVMTSTNSNWIPPTSTWQTFWKIYNYSWAVGNFH